MHAQQQKFKEKLKHFFSFPLNFRCTRSGPGAFVSNEEIWCGFMRLCTAEEKALVEWARCM